jgi:Fe2+ transport system protein FeoA
VLLRDLQVGQKGVVESVTGERSYRRRLMELGFVPGTEVAVLRVAPLGDPIEVEIRGACLSLRHAEAARITLAERRS